MPIHLLATELLSEIFLWLAALHARRSDCEWNMRYGWMDVMEVCKHWYGAAHSCPTLWSHISIDSTFRDGHNAVDRLLRQSRTAPLSVDVASSLQDTRLSVTKAIAPVLEHTDRIQRLRVRILGDLSPDPMREIVGIPLARLTELDIGLKLYRPNHMPLDLSWWLTAASLPSLRHLSLQNCLISWDSSIFAGLQTFSLDHSDLHGSSASHLADVDKILTLDELLSALNSGLRVFDLRGVSPFPSGFTLKARFPYEIISLPNLRTLALTMDAILCSEFVARVQLASHCSWFITLVHVNRSKRISDVALPQLSGDVNVLSCTLKVRSTKERLCLSAMFTTDEEILPVHNDMELLTWEKLAPLDLSRILIGAAGWRCITELEVRSDGKSFYGGTASWKLFLLETTELRGLVVHLGPRYMNGADMEEVVQELVRALAEHDTRTHCTRYSEQGLAAAESRTVLCPHLQELAFAGPSAPAFSFRRRGRTPDRDVFQNSTKTWIQLVDCLKLRADCNSKLRDISWEDELLDVPVDFLVSIQASVDRVVIPGILPSTQKPISL